MKTRILLAALPLAVFSAACDNDPSGPGETENKSQVAISYSGGVSGSFAVEGEYVPGTAPNTQAFAIAIPQSDGSLEVNAYRQRGGARFDIASITLPNPAVGQRTVELCPGETCSSVSLGLDIGQSHGSEAAQTCHLRTGTVTVTALSATRVSGTVSGSGFCLQRGGGDELPFQISSGTFSVDVFQQSL
ncbi:hypothetical protein [Longimicrobium sp.]|uniref:hypothetical protein n=1 Tax=Longimicrobium sp. TaxID=2029185 RepID=UPI003B3B964E